MSIESRDRRPPEVADSEQEEVKEDPEGFGGACEDIEMAINYGAFMCLDAQVRTKDGGEVIGQLWLNGEHHPDNEFGVKVDGDVVGFDFDDVETIRLGIQGIPIDPKEVKLVFGYEG